MSVFYKIHKGKTTAFNFNDASPCFCSAAESQQENMQAHAPYVWPCQAPAQHALSCSGANRFIRKRLCHQGQQA